VLDHPKDSEGELAFLAGDTVFVPVLDESATVFTGVCKGAVGTFPACFVKEDSTGKVFGAAGAPVTVKCEALGNYSAKSSTELSIKAGDTVTVACMDSKSMWMCVANGKKGYLPRQYLRDVNAPPSSTTQSAASPTLTSDQPKEVPKVLRCVAVKQYHAQFEGHLSFTPGDVIMVSKKTSEDYWTGVLRGNVGEDSNCIVLCSYSFLENKNLT
jgi:hypothetical protein